MKACYIHVPFCTRICAYCDFTRCRYQASLADKWLQRVCADLQLQDDSFSSLYIGGGTPTSLSNTQLSVLLAATGRGRNDEMEFTIEANPDSLDEQKIRIMAKGGVNRISLGVQTFQSDLQEIIARRHTVKEIKGMLQCLIDHGISNISIDLMYGLPSQTMEKWKKDLQIAVSLPIHHISLYALTIEENSRFGREGVCNIDPQLEADMYEYAISYLQEHGFWQYEISNFAKPDYEAKHNIAYWKYEDFIGIGCGASGKENHMRYDNTRNLHTYITEGAMPSRTDLSKEDEMFEMVMMSLRMKKGLCLKRFETCFACHIEDVYGISIQKHIEQGNLMIDDGYLKTTYQGMLFLHDVLIDFM
ncbi:MAG: radical SAM family heme chaperone HemW [Erysipelotrichaceae bacterium]|jgi:oxygen-independent coproporphyrinogen-3 oxidase|nr:radical SAM family heme chaperone HemW [Erysipelotrichaceae bacterium]